MTPTPGVYVSIETPHRRYPDVNITAFQCDPERTSTVEWLLDEDASIFSAFWAMFQNPRMKKHDIPSVMALAVHNTIGDERLAHAIYVYVASLLQGHRIVNANTEELEECLYNKEVFNAFFSIMTSRAGHPYYPY